MSESSRLPGGARDYTWPPAEPENFLALKHGAYSSRLVEPRALEIAQEMAEGGMVPGYLQAPEYRPALLGYCRTLAQVARVRSWLASTARAGIPEELDREGNVRAATRLLERLETSAATRGRNWA